MSDEQEKKPTTKFSKTDRSFGSIKQQFETIGGRKEESDMPQSTITSKRQDVITSKQQDTPEMKRQTVYMPKVLATRLKIYAASTGEDISGIITDLVEAFLAEKE